MWSIATASASDIARLQAWLPQQLDINWTVEDLHDYLNKAGYHLLVAVSEGEGSLQSETAGFLLSQVVLDESTLLLVAVNPELRGRGLGKILVRDYLKRLAANDITAAHLEVRQSNLSAVRLYESLGFDLVGERKDYYPSLKKNGQRELALVFRKTL